MGKREDGKEKEKVNKDGWKGQGRLPNKFYTATQNLDWAVGGMILNNKTKALFICIL